MTIHPYMAIAAVVPVIQVLAQTTPSGSETGAWVTGGSAVIAVGALAFIARQFAAGRLIARDTAEHIKNLEEINAKMLVLIEDLKAVVERSERREEQLFEKAFHNGS